MSSVIHGRSERSASQVRWLSEGRSISGAPENLDLPVSDSPRGCSLRTLSGNVSSRSFKERRPGRLRDGPVTQRAIADWSSGGARRNRTESFDPPLRFSRQAPPQRFYSGAGHRLCGVRIHAPRTWKPPYGGENPPPHFIRRNASLCPGSCPTCRRIRAVSPSVSPCSLLPLWRRKSPSSSTRRRGSLQTSWRMRKRCLERANLSFATALVATLDARDRYTAGHSAAVAIYARNIASRLGLPAEDVQLAHLCGLVHDIGKIGLPPGPPGSPARSRSRSGARWRSTP